MQQRKHMTKATFRDISLPVHWRADRGRKLGKKGLGGRADRGRKLGKKGLGGSTKAGLRMERRPTERHYRGRSVGNSSTVTRERGGKKGEEWGERTPCPRANGGVSGGDDARDTEETRDAALKMD